MRLHLFLAAAALATACFSAHADTLTEVSSTALSGATLLASTGTQNDNKTGITFDESVYQDNAICPECLDFVISVDDPGSTGKAVDKITASDFAGYTLEYAYEDEGDVAPTSVKSTKLGNVAFSFSNLIVNGDSDSLIIYTDATAYTTGGLKIGSEGADPPAFQPEAPSPTPEPSSLILLGTGLLGALGATRRRLV